MSFLNPANTALNATQKAAISVQDVVQQVEGDDTTPVVSYTVVTTGNYPSQFLMRLGDLQRSAIRVLNIVMQSAPFGELAGLQGVSGVEIAPYSEQFGLADYLSVEAGRVSH